MPPRTKATIFADAGKICITAFISPTRAERQLAREMVLDGQFIEVYVNAPLEVCERWLEFKPEEVVARIAPRPILFIGEEASDLVPPEEVPLFYERAAQPKKLVMAPAAIVPSRYNKFDWANEGRYIPWMWNHIAGWLREHLPAR